MRAPLTRPVNTLSVEGIKIFKNLLCCTISFYFQKREFLFSYRFFVEEFYTSSKTSFDKVREFPFSTLWVHSQTAFTDREGNFLKSCLCKILGQILISSNSHSCFIDNVVIHTKLKPMCFFLNLFFNYTYCLWPGRTSVLHWTFYEVSFLKSINKLKKRFSCGVCKLFLENFTFC